MKINFQSLICETFGSSYFYIDDSGNQKVAFANIHFAYQHKNGGSNGTRVADIWYNLDGNKWSGRAVGTNEIIALN